MTKTAFSTQRTARNANPTQDQAKDHRDAVVDEHRDLEVERFFAVRIDLGRVVAFGQPDNERSEQVPGEMKKNAEQRAGVTQNVPDPDIRRTNGCAGGPPAGNGGGVGSELVVSIAISICLFNVWTRLARRLDSEFCALGTKAQRGKAKGSLRRTGADGDSSAPVLCRCRGGGLKYEAEGKRKN
jgi:hypothetical protein